MYIVNTLIFLCIKLVHNYCGFLRYFFFFRLAFCLIFFHKNNPLFSVSENVYQKLYPYSPYYALPLRERLECNTVISRSHLFGEGTMNKNQLKEMGQEIQIGRYKADEGRRGRSSNFD